MAVIRTLESYALRASGSRGTHFANVLHEHVHGTTGRMIADGCSLP